MSQPEPRVLLDGLAIVECPRWHDDRLWFCHWGMEEIVAVDLDGNAEVMAPGLPGLGWGISWLPDGRLLIAGEPDLRRQEPDGSVVTHADLSALSTTSWSEILVDGRGNIYVNSINFDFLGGGGEPTQGLIALVTPDGAVRQVAGDLHFPNGMVVTPDNRTLIISESFAAQLTAFDIESDGSLTNRRVWAGDVGPDGICLDADGAIWTSGAVMGDTVVRVREGREVLDEVPIDLDCFATMLGGPDRRSLFLCMAKWLGPDKIDEAVERRTGQVRVLDAPAPGVGWP